MDWNTLRLEQERHLVSNACYDKDATRKIDETTSFWPAYKEDLERIIHSKALRRYSDKTQVVYLVANDHITHRGYHVQCVSSFSRAIALYLGLNVDLVEAIALGHDVGHPPFGHEGEEYLSEITLQKQLGAFSHANHSCRLLSEIEPLNLTLATLDGFLCHDGGMRKSKQRPQFNKSWQEHYEERSARKSESDQDFSPKTLEGSLVKVADSVSYLAKDLEDACSLGIIKASDIPKTVLGTTNREILQSAAKDIISESKGCDMIGFSDEVFASLQMLRTFNFERIYTFGPLKIESEKIRSAYWQLFELLDKEFIAKGKKSVLWTQFLHSKSDEYKEAYASAQLVVDFIAGMTDRYFVRLLEQMIIPQTIRI